LLAPAAFLRGRGFLLEIDVTEKVTKKRGRVKKQSRTDELKEAITAKRPRRKPVIEDSDRLKTGSTLLDLAISGNRGGGFAKGKYFWMVGDSSSGKTFLTLTCMAEASINKNFDDYRFIYDNVEDGALMDMDKYFGRRMADRLEAPATDKGSPKYSNTIEDFYYNLDDAFADGRPFIYLLDSMDSLDSKYSEKKFQEGKKATRGGKVAKGDYGDGKAKINSTRIKKVVNQLTASGSILIVLSQTRDNINAGMFEEQQTHAGGKALKFYSTVQLWSSVGKKEKRTVADKDLQVGVTCRVKIKKNRISGKDRTVEFPIYYDTGIDDVGGMIDWLTTYKFWKKAGGCIDPSPDFDCGPLRRADLISHIEDEDLREELEIITEEAWANVEARVAVKRKSKYD